MPLCLCVLILSASWSAFAAQPRSIEVNKIAAVVNGEIITLHEVRRQAGPELARMGINPNDRRASQQVDDIVQRILDLMISDILLRQEATKLKITASDSEVENELRKLIQRNQTTPQEFEARLVSQGSSMAILKERLRNNILSQRIVGLMIARKVVVTKDEISKYFSEHQKDFTAEKSVDVSLIVFAPTADVDTAYAKIKDGSLKFEDAARQYSIGPEAANGGRLGNIAWKDLASSIRSEISHLSDGQVSGIFLLDLNKSLLRLNGSSPGKQMTLEEATPEIEGILREPRMEARFKEYTQQLRNKAVIDIRI